MSAISAPVAQVYKNRGTFLGLVPAPIITVSLVNTLDVWSGLFQAGKSITSKIQFLFFRIVKQVAKNSNRKRESRSC